MRQETKIITYYKFSELSDDAKSKVLEKFYDINVCHDWWEFVYSDAENIGLKITAFDMDRGNKINGDFTTSCTNVAKKIISDHGDTCQTHILANEFLNSTAGMDDDSAEMDITCHEFERAIKEEYLSILKRELEFLTGEAQIIESIEANDYEFDVNGNLI